MRLLSRVKPLEIAIVENVLSTPPRSQHPQASGGTAGCAACLMRPSRNTWKEQEGGPSLPTVRATPETSKSPKAVSSSPYVPTGALPMSGEQCLDRRNHPWPGVHAKATPLPSHAADHAAISQSELQTRFGSFDHLTRDMLIQDLPQGPLALTIADFHGHRQARGQCNHVRVEERRACLEADTHCSAVNLAKNVIRQITAHVLHHHPHGGIIRRHSLATDHRVGRSGLWRYPA